MHSSVNLCHGHGQLDRYVGYVGNHIYCHQIIIVRLDSPHDSSDWIARKSDIVLLPPFVVTRPVLVFVPDSHFEIGIDTGIMIP